MSRSAVPIRSTHLVLPALLSVALLCMAAPLHAQDAEHPMEAKGIQPTRGSFSVLPWESLDTYSGSVVLTFTDLVLPGNAGLDLRVTRVFNSKGAGWHVAVGPSMILSTETSSPYGPPPPPKVKTVDGGAQPTFETAQNSGVYMTTSLWRYTKAMHALETPDGVIYHFLDDGRLSQIGDVFGNTIDVTYETNLTRVVQHLGSGEDRTVLLVQDDQGRVSAVQYGTRTWTYTWGTSFGDLTVTPPVGRPWQFQRTTTGPTTWTYTATTPNGGWVAYDFAQYQRTARKHGGVAWTTKVNSRRSGGPVEAAIPAATWTVTYDGQESFGAVVEGAGRRTHYVHGLIGETSVFLSSVTVFAETDTAETSPLETTTYGYRIFDTGNVTNVAPVGIEWPPYDPELDIVRSDRYPLLIKQVQTTRGGATFTRVFTYCGEPGWTSCLSDPVNDAGLPQRIAESGTGDLGRDLSFSYRHSFSAGYIRGRVASMTVSQGGTAYTSAYTYADSSGFLESRSAWGVATTFGQDGRGNIASQTDASTHTTTFTHAWGVLQNTTTPAYTITRAINPDGTVASETRQNQTDRFWYDDLGRITRVEPRVGAPTLTTYDNTAGRTVVVSRTGDGTTSSTTQTLDGYGRVVRTATAAGVTTDVVYDAWGRRVTESAPRQGVNAERHDTLTQYDALDRVTRFDRPDGSSVLYGYDGLDVAITESVQSGQWHVTHQHWGASGSPAQARLLGVQDPSGTWTTYAYTGLGALTAVCGPGTTGPGPCTTSNTRRTWSYNNQHQLISESHPESGSRSYTYHADGMLWKTIDAGVIPPIETTYAYDSNHRLSQVSTNTGRPATTFTYDDWDNRTLANNGYVQSVFAYTAGKRLTSRSDTVTNQTFVTQYTSYDARDNLLTLVYPSGQSVAYTYDADNRITTVKDAASSTPYASGVSYHPSGGVAHLTAGNSVTHTIEYDDRARPLSVTALPLALTYAYDHLGNIRTLTDNRSGYGQSFSYDALDRLTGASGPGGAPTFYGTLAYAYDAYGNRSGASSPATYDDPTQRLLSTVAGQVTTTYTHDGVGNLTGESGGRTASYVYTPERLVETATMSGVTTTYTYDADGQRTRATDSQSPATTRYFVHGLDAQLLAEYEERNGTLTWQVAYLYLGSRLLGAVRPAPNQPPGTTALLTVGKTGSGSGTITSSPAGLNCGSTCSQSVPINTVVSLVATPASGSVFAGWSGDTDCGEGQVAMSAARTCTASFQPAVTGDPRMWIDIPGGGAQVQPVRIAGWAIDLAAATGSGVDTVHLWAYPNPGSGTPAIFLGVAWYGGDRPDIAAAFGQDRFRFSGYDLTTSVTLAPNTYQLVVFAHSTVTGTFNQAQTVNIEIRTPTPAQWIDIPGNYAQVGAAFVVAGWAIDLNAPSGVGVDRVDLSARLNGTGTPIYLGSSATVPARPDIGAYFGSQFLNCAWGITASGLSPGTYLITVSPHNTSIDGHTAPSTVWVTVGQ